MHNHFSPFLDAAPYDWKAFESLPKLYIFGLLKELFDKAHCFDSQEIESILGLLKNLHVQGLLKGLENHMSLALHAVLERHDAHHAKWLKLLLSLVSLQNHLPRLEQLQALAQHPDVNIRRWVFSQDHSRRTILIPQMKFQISLNPGKLEDSYEVMKLGLQDDDPDILINVLTFCFDHSPQGNDVVKILPQYFKHPHQEVRVWGLLAGLKHHIEPQQRNQALRIEYPHVGSELQNLILVSIYRYGERLKDIELTQWFDDWISFLLDAINSEDEQLKANGFHILKHLGNQQDKEFLKRTVLEAKSAYLFSVVLSVLAEFDEPLFAQEIFDRIQNSTSFSDKVEGLEHLVKYHPEFCKVHLPGLVVNQPQLASRIIKKLRELGWRDIPETWLEVARDTNFNHGNNLPEGPWLEV